MTNSFKRMAGHIRLASPKDSFFSTSVTCQNTMTKHIYDPKIQTHSPKFLYLPSNFTGSFCKQSLTKYHICLILLSSLKPNRASNKQLTRIYFSSNSKSTWTQEVGCGHYQSKLKLETCREVFHPTVLARLYESATLQNNLKCCTRITDKKSSP